MGRERSRFRAWAVRCLFWKRVLREPVSGNKQQEQFTLFLCGDAKWSKTFKNLKPKKLKQ